MENRWLERAPIATCMTCPICKDILEEATTISLCLHAFCRKCIYGRFSDEEFDTCPVCDVYLGTTPQDKLRPDRNLQAIGESIFSRAKTGEPSKSRRKSKSSSSLAAKTKRRSKSGSKKSKESSSSSLNWPPEEDKEDEVVKPCVNQSDNEEGSDTSRSKSDSPPAVNADEPEKNDDSDRIIAVDVMRLDRANMPVWFSLVASEEKEEGARLPQLPSRFLRINTAKMAVSYIQKYIAKKFELAKEDEVVIKFQGEALLPSTLVWEVEERWIRWGLSLGLVSAQTLVGRSAQEFVMPLTYSRNQNQA